MANESGNNTNKDINLQGFISENNFNLQNLTENDKNKIAENYTISDLLAYMNNLKNDNEKANILSVIEKRNKIDQDERSNLQVQNKALEEIKYEKDKQKDLQEKNVAALKKLLDYDDNSNGQESNEKMNNILEIIALNNKNKEILDKIKELQNQLNNPSITEEKKAEIKEKLSEKKRELKGLIGQKDNLYYMYFGENFDDNNGRGIQEFKRRGSLIGRGKSDTGQEMVGIMSPLKQKRMARRRLNRVIKQMNEIGKDSTAGMKMVMNRCYLNGIRPIRRGMKDIANTFRMKDPKEFSKQYDEQAKIFITDLTDKLTNAKGFDNEDRKTIDLIKKRLNWYKEDYKRKFLQM